MGTAIDIIEDLNFGVHPEWRIDPDKEEQQYHTDLSLTYNILKRWDVGMSYRKGELYFDEDDKDSFDIERFCFDTSYTWKLGDFRIEPRIRYTNGHENDEAKEYLRYRLKLGYDWDRLNLRPFLAYEKYDSLESDYTKNPNVYSAGFTWKLSKHHQFKTEYRWVDKLHTDNDHSIVKLSYQFKF